MADCVCFECVSHAQHGSVRVCLSVYPSRLSDTSLRQSFYLVTVEKERRKLSLCGFRRR